MPLPHVSVLLAVHNGSRYLTEAVESILGQSYQDFELIVVDDASDDATPDLLNKFRYRDSRIRVLRNPENLGLTRSLNRGLGAVRGRWVARLDADDRCLPHRLATQLTYLGKHPAIELLGSAYHKINQDGNRVGLQCPPQAHTAIRWQGIFHNPFCHSTIMVSTNLLRQADGYDEAYPQSQDFDLWSRLLQQTQAANLAKPLIEWRQHPGSISQTNNISQLDLANQIAQRNMNLLLSISDLPLECVHKLRSWYHTFPRNFTEHDLTTAQLFLDLLQHFLLLPDVQASAARSIAQRWLDWFLSALPLPPLAGPQQRQLFRRACSMQGGMLAYHLSRRPLRRIWQTIHDA